MDLDDKMLALELILAGAIIEGGGVLAVRKASWDSELILGKKVVIEVGDDETLTLTLEETDGN